MRCPKCHYLSFDPEPRCRNCGYSFSLADPELSLKPPPDQPAEPLRDFELRPAGRPVASEPAVEMPLRSAAAVRKPAAQPVLDRGAVQIGPAAVPIPVAATPPPRAIAAVPPPQAPARSAAPPVEAPRPKPAEPAPVTTELPLFVKGLSSPAPMPPPVPDVPARRAPKPAPAARKLGPLDRDLLEDLQRLERQEIREQARKPAVETSAGAALAAAPAASHPAASHAAADASAVGLARRLGAALVDLALVAGILAGVVWVTLRWLELPFDQLTSLPLVPFAGFLVLIALGYILMFTAAGGQTIGKMLAGIRVVDDAGDAEGASLSTRRAVYRSLLALPSVLALGAGFVPALLGDRRAVHDRLAHTRVVRI